MATYVDNGRDIVLVTHDEITSEKSHGDNSRSFKLIGGPLHDCVFRVYPPFDAIVFDGTKGFRPGKPCRYEIHPPLNPKGKWVYVHVADNR